MCKRKSVCSTHAMTTTTTMSSTTSVSLALYKVWKLVEWINITEFSLLVVDFVYRAAFRPATVLASFHGHSVTSFTLYQSSPPFPFHPRPCSTHYFRTLPTPSRYHLTLSGCRALYLEFSKTQPHTFLSKPLVHFRTLSSSRDSLNPSPFTPNPLTFLYVLNVRNSNVSNEAACMLIFAAT